MRKDGVLILSYKNPITKIQPYTDLKNMNNRIYDNICWREITRNPGLAEVHGSAFLMYFKRIKYFGISTNQLGNVF